MTCEELLQALNAYVDGDALPAFCEKYAAHLAECNPCQVVVDNIRQTIRLYRAGEPYPMPPEFQDSLRQQLRRRWLERFGKLRPTSAP
ncbi:MAG: zf-HC2 domain-containing protein [Gemmataceae bacterium]